MAKKMSPQLAFYYRNRARLLTEKRAYDTSERGLAAKREWTRKNLKKLRAIQREWYLKNSARVKAQHDAYAARNRHKRIAKSKLNDAVKRGDIKKKPCEFCGKNKAQAHHDDYTKPLDVRWLCTKHHAEVHRQIRIAKGLKVTSGRKRST